MTGMGARELDESLDGVIQHHGVGVEQHDKLGIRGLRRPIDRPRKTEVLTRIEQFNVGVLTDDRERIVCRAVIDHDHLLVKRAALVQHAPQALAYQMGGVVGNDDDRSVGGHHRTADFGRGLIGFAGTPTWTRSPIAIRSQFVIQTFGDELESAPIVVFRFCRTREYPLPCRVRSEWSQFFMSNTDTTPLLTLASLLRIVSPPAGRE